MFQVDLAAFIFFIQLFQKRNSGAGFYGQHALPSCNSTGTVSALTENN